MNAMVDGIDKGSLAAIAVLSAWFAVLVFMHDVAAPKTGEKHAFAAQQASPEFAAGVKTAENLLAAENMTKFTELLSALIKDYPYQAEPFMLLADYHIRVQEPVAAMHAFRQALDLDLVYLEKKNPKYQGKKIRNIVREAEVQINTAMAVDPGNPVMLENRKTVYYMLRKLAGGCSD